ncbi:MAG: hypothetical protein FJ096_21365 [Deltaproteobacteria bacterium]|nr:hypothetical protein [Deltaproteobacteria bacterium]
MKPASRLRFGALTLVTSAALFAAFPFGCSSDEGGTGGVAVDDGDREWR